MSSKCTEVNMRPCYLEC